MKPVLRSSRRSLHLRRSLLSAEAARILLRFSPLAGGVPFPFFFPLAGGVPFLPFSPQAGRRCRRRMRGAFCADASGWHDPAFGTPARGEWSHLEYRNARGPSSGAARHLLPACGEKKSGTVPACGEKKSGTVPACGEKGNGTVRACGEKNRTTFPARGKKGRNMPPFARRAELAPLQPGRHGYAALVLP